MTIAKAGGRELSQGWQSKITVNNGGEYLPVTDWETACNAVRKFLALGEPAMSDTSWSQLVNDSWDQQEAPGEWLIPLTIDLLEILALNGEFQNEMDVDGMALRVQIKAP